MFTEEANDYFKAGKPDPVKKLTKESLSEAIKIWLATPGNDIEELARVSGVGKRTIELYKAQHGNPSLESMELLTNAMNADIWISFRFGETQDDASQ